MKKLITYQCEICRREYSNEKNAIECEKRGYFDPTKITPGFMFPYKHNGFVGIFSIPEIGHIKTERTDKHFGIMSYWACRRYGDDSFPNLCGSDYVYSSQEELNKFIRYRIMDKEYIGCPEFNRMVINLKSRGITPSYSTENGIVFVD